MKNKNIMLATILSVLACAIHAVVLNTPFNYYVYTSVMKVILFILCPMIYFMVSKDGNFKDMFINGNKKNIKRSLGFGFIVFVFILISSVVVRLFTDQAMIVEALAKNGITRGNFYLVFIYVVLINAALEEIFFRGFVYMTLYRMNFKRYAYIYSSLLFAFYHVAILNNAVAPGTLIFFIISLAISGLVFNYLVVKCRNISGSLIVHISANLAINLTVYAYYL